MGTSVSLGSIAQLTNAEIIGEPQTLVEGICALDEPIATHLAFTKDTHPKKVTKVLSELAVRALILPSKINRDLLSGRAGNFLLVENPQVALLKIIPLFFPPEKLSGTVSPKADVHPSARIASGVTIGAFVSIGEDVVIEEGTTVYPHACIYRGAVIGKGCTIHAHAVVREFCRLEAGAILQNGAIIGADGFGYIGETKDGMPSITKVPQVGIVVLKTNAEVGANACVDRAAIGTTRIGPHTKLDNLVQVGHNTKIGPFSILCGQVGIAGSTSIGAGVVLGGAVGVADHLTIADGCRVGGGSAVLSHIPEKGDYIGYPAIRAMTWRRQNWALAQLPKVLEDLATGHSTEADQQKEE